MLDRSMLSGLSVLLAVGCSAAAPAQPPSRSASTTTAQPPAPPAAVERVLAPDAAATPGLRVEVGCSEADLRVAIATISWQASEERVAEQSVDVTVYKEGFEQNWYVTVPAGRGGKFEPSPGLRAAEGRPTRALELEAAPPRRERREQAEPVVVEVRNLEPGVLYRWRIVSRAAAGAVPSPEVETQAPVCVTDETKEP